MTLTDEDVERLWNENRGVLKEYSEYPWGTFEKPMLHKVARAVFAIARPADRTAEREAARKVLDDLRDYITPHWILNRDMLADWSARYLAAEFDAGERVTLSDGSVVWRENDGAWCRGFARDQWSVRVFDWTGVLNAKHTGADFDAVKRLAEQRGAER